MLRGEVTFRMPLKTETNADTVAPELLAWWHVNGRKDFAWQQNPTRYRVWISEVMLQQTQVTTVVPYYQRFIAEFPTVRDLAAADPDRVLHVWSGLGYYARARNLHKAAGLISAKFDGELPGDIDALQSLPGIGRSTAGAILALADDRRHPILDGNAKRVYARFFAIAGWPGQGAVLKKLWALAEACTPATGAAIYTQAIMDLGATVCLRRNPGCARCPLADSCLARQQHLLDSIPGKRPKRNKPLCATVLVLAVCDDGAVLLQRRPDTGIWGGLWCFPEIGEAAKVAGWCLETIGYLPGKVRVCPVIRHSFTHFDLDMTPVVARLTATDARLMEGDRWLWYKQTAPAAVGLAAPVARLLENIGELS